MAQPNCCAHTGVDMGACSHGDVGSIALRRFRLFCLPSSINLSRAHSPPLTIFSATSDLQASIWAGGPAVAAAAGAGEDPNRVAEMTRNPALTAL